jgi:hypothetical protein
VSIDRVALILELTPCITRKASATSETLLFWKRPGPGLRHGPNRVSLILELVPRPGLRRRSYRVASILEAATLLSWKQSRSYPGGRDALIAEIEAVLSWKPSRCYIGIESELYWLDREKVGGAPYGN